MTEPSLKKKTTIGIFWSLTDRLLTQVVQLVISIIMARLLLPDDYGLIGMLTIFTALSSLFVDGGFTSALIQKKDRTDVDFSTVFYFNIGVSILCYLFLFAIAPLIANFFHTPVLTVIIRVLFLNLIINSLCVVQNAKLSITMNFRAKAMISFIAIAVSGSVSVFFALNGYGVWSLVIQSLCSCFITMILLFIFCRWKPLFIFSKTSFKELFNFGSKLLGVGIVAAIINNLYTILIGRFFSSTQVGYYTKGLQLPVLASDTVSSVLLGVSYPAMTSIQDEKERLVSIYCRLIRMTGFFIIPAMTALAIITEPFVRYFLTEKWMPTVVLMQWICFARIFTPISSLNMNILNVIGRSDLFLKVDMSKLPMTILALIITIPLGIKAVVIGHFITSFFAFFINTYYSGKMFGYGAFNQIKDLTPTLICSSIMGIGMLLVSSFIHADLLKIIISIVTGGILYYTFALLLKIESVKEVNLLINKIWVKIK